MDYLVPGWTAHSGRNERKLLERHRDETGLLLSVWYPYVGNRGTQVTLRWSAIHVGFEGTEVRGVGAHWPGPLWFPCRSGLRRLEVRSYNGDVLVDQAVVIGPSGPTLIRLDVEYKRGVPLLWPRTKPYRLFRWDDP
jgi:hypothetical protein